MNKQSNGRYSTSERVTLIVFAISLALYLMNIFLGKASVHWGWTIFHLGNIGEFLLLLIASISFIIAALHREAVMNKNKE
jgi:hypothetical protein